MCYCIKMYNIKKKIFLLRCYAKKMFWGSGDLLLFFLEFSLPTDDVLL